MKCAGSRVAHDARAGHRAGFFVAHRASTQAICSSEPEKQKQVMRFEMGQSKGVRDQLITEVDASLADRLIAICWSGV
jgi:hypothetical protein